MKIILAMVQSVDGKTTKWNTTDIHSWTSREDQEYFSKLIEQNNCIIMGRKTYEAARKMIKHAPDKLRVVMTNNPQQYNNITIPKQLEFTSESPKALIKRLEESGFKTALLVGGAEINTLFFREKLVNELWLTIEPIIFGKGNGLISESDLNIKLKLLNIEKLNETGSLLLKYQFI